MKNNWVLWPIYFDVDASRQQGRKLPLDLCIKNPNIDDIYKAAKKLGYNPVKQDKSYPSRWWRKEGRILISKNNTKMEALKNISKYLQQSKAPTEK